MAELAFKELNQNLSRRLPKDALHKCLFLWLPCPQLGRLQQPWRQATGPCRQSQNLLGESALDHLQYGNNTEALGRYIST